MMMVMRAMIMMMMMMMISANTIPTYSKLHQDKGEEVVDKESVISYADGFEEEFEGLLSLDNSVFCLNRSASNKIHEAGISWKRSCSKKYRNNHIRGVARIFRGGGGCVWEVKIQSCREVRGRAPLGKF